MMMLLPDDTGSAVVDVLTGFEPEPFCDIITVLKLSVELSG
jgi:hypothetical protein